MSRQQAAAHRQQIIQRHRQYSFRWESKATLADVKDISKVLNSNTVVEFGVYEPMNRITIKIKDKETGEVLKEIPSEKMLKMFTKACELAGLLVDEKM